MRKINTELAKLYILIEEIRSNVIGLFYINGRWELVIEEFEDTLNTIDVTVMFAVSETFGVPKKYGEYKKFPDGKNMNEMLSNPSEYQEFIESMKRKP